MLLDLMCAFAKGFAAMQPMFEFDGDHEGTRLRCTEPQVGHWGTRSSPPVFSHGGPGLSRQIIERF
jgi:hypothetical protein